MILLPCTWHLRRGGLYRLSHAKAGVGWGCVAGGGGGVQPVEPRPWAVGPGRGSCSTSHKPRLGAGNAGERAPF